MVEKRRGGKEERRRGIGEDRGEEGRKRRWEDGGGEGRRGK